MAIKQVGETQAGHRLGERAPSWSLPLLDGGELASDALQGTKTLLLFWGSW